MCEVMHNKITVEQQNELPDRLTHPETLRRVKHCAKVHGWTSFKPKCLQNDYETCDDATKGKDSMLTDYTNDLMVTPRPYQAKESADRVAVFSHVRHLKSNSWLHAERTLRDHGNDVSSSSSVGRPSQGITIFSKMDLFLGWSAVPTKAHMKDLPLVVTSVRVCLLWICQTPEIKSSSASGVVCVWVNVLQLHGYTWLCIRLCNSFFIFHTNSKAVSLNLCRHICQAALLHQEHMETKAHHHSRDNPTFCSFI